MENTPCTYRISIKAIIEDSQGRIMLLREEDGSWELPGGGLEHGENPQEALPREILEETGCKTIWVSDRPEAFWTINKEVGSPTLKWFGFVAFRAKISGEFTPNPENGSEAQEAAYFTREEARALQLHDNTKPFFA